MSFDSLSLSVPSIEQLFWSVVILVVAWLISSLVLQTLKRSKALTSLTKSTIDDEVVRLLRGPVHLGFQLAGVLLALRYLFPGLSYQGYGYTQAAAIVAAIWGAYAFNRLIRGLMQWHESQSREDGVEGRRGTFGFLNTLISILVWSLAIAFILNQVGIDISALLAGLGIAGIAVALALQNTLSGLFSAVGLAIDKPVRHGDYVELEDGTAGFVEDISIRSTRIRTFDQSLVIVPNGKLTSMIITNKYLPGQEVTIQVLVGVAYGTDLEKAERVAIEVATTVLEDQRAKGDGAPFVRYVNFGDSSIEMKVFLQVTKFLDQFVVKHEFMKALKVAFEKEQIDIPYPQLDVRVQK